jgi:serine/threonine-protein kinase HipA
VRIHQEDCCQALSVHPSRKYEHDGGPSVTQIALLLRDVIPRADTADTDVHRLCQAAAFNWLILGTDAHAKNYSLLLDGPDVRLAPLYDIASAAPYGDHPSKLRLAQKVDRYYRPTIIEARHWERLATSCHADPDHLVQRVRDMASRVEDAMSDVIRRSEFSRGERRAATKVLDTLTPWVRTCKRRLDH